MVPTGKYGEGIVLIWACMCADGVGEITFIDGIMNVHFYIETLDKFMLSSLKKLGARVFSCRRMTQSIPFVSLSHFCR